MNLQDLLLSLKATLSRLLLTSLSCLQTHRELQNKTLWGGKAQPR